MGKWKTRRTTKGQILFFGVIIVLQALNLLSVLFDDGSNPSVFFWCVLAIDIALLVYLPFAYRRAPKAPAPLDQST